MKAYVILCFDSGFVGPRVERVFIANDGDVSEAREISLSRALDKTGNYVLAVRSVESINELDAAVDEIVNEGSEDGIF